MPERHCRLLILEDSPEDRTVVRLLLEEAPGRTWNFVEAEKGKAALKLLESESFDCVLLDYQLPDMNGVKFLQELKLRFGAMHVPVVMFTGSGGTAIAVSALKAGAQDYLSKDILRVEILIRAIDNAIERIQLLREGERQQGELAASSARLRLLEAAVQGANESILITDAEMEEPGPKIVFVNQAFTRITGYAESDVIGKSPRVLQGPKTDRAVLDRLRRNLSDTQPFSGETVNYRKNGSEFVLDWDIAPIADAQGKLTHYVAIQRDATERNRAEQRLRDGEQRLELALRGADLGLWDWDFTTGRQICDQRCAAMLGYRVEDLETTVEGWAALVHPDDLTGYRESLDKHLRGEVQTFEAEFRMRARDGQWRWILSRGRLLDRLPNGDPHRLVGTQMDITERRNAERALLRSNEDLQQFAYAASHDLQEPLRRMTWYAELLGRKLGKELDADGELYLRTIQSEAGRASQLMTDLLAYSQASAEGQEVLFEACSCEQAVAAVVLVYKDTIQQAGAVIEHGPLPVVRGNRVQIERLFENLIGNALKYRKPGEPPRIEISAESGPREWTFRISDNGVGFEPDRAEYIFGAFRRLHGHEQPGTGLGLAICQRIVEKMGGRIWAESTPDVGSTFGFSVPAHSFAVAAGNSKHRDAKG